MTEVIEAELTWTGQKFEPGISVAVGDDGRIARVGHLRREATRVLEGQALLPGFVNAHSHAFQRGLRGKGERFADGAGSFWSWREAMYSLVEQLGPEDFLNVTTQAFMEMRSAGVTTVGEFHYFHHGPATKDFGYDRLVLKAARAAKIRLVLLVAYYRTGGVGKSLGAGQRRFETTSPEAYWNAYDSIATLLTPQQSMGVVVHSIRAAALDELKAMHSEAMRRGLVFHMHIEEQRQEIEESRAAYGKTPMRALLDTVGRAEHITAVHCTHTTAEDRAAFLDAGGRICLCPLTEANLGDGIASLDGVPFDRICLGSDSNARIDMVEEMRWMEYAQRLRGERRGVSGRRGGVRRPQPAGRRDVRRRGRARHRGGSDPPGTVGRFRGHRPQLDGAGGGHRGHTGGSAHLRRRFIGGHIDLCRGTLADASGTEASHMSSLNPTTVRKAVESRRDELIAFASSLVRSPSLPGEEGPVQELVAAQLRSMGLETRVLPVRFDNLRDHPAFGDDGFTPDGRVDVIGRWAGPGGGRSLILNGHVDVVSPGDASLWTDSPWSGVVRDGFLHGRGSCDMKSGLAAGIFSLVVLHDLAWRPRGDIIVESVTGEESGGCGTLAAIVDGIRADGAVILEPTGLALCPVQSGALTFRIIVPGKAAHGAMRQHGVSAIELFARLHSAILGLERARHGLVGTDLYDDPDYVAPVSIGTIRGGEWHSTVAELVVAEGRFGVFPGESVEAARASLEECVRSAASEDPWLMEHPPRIEWFEGQFESGETPSDHPLVQGLAQAHRAVLRDDARVRGVPYGSDLRLFTNHANMPAVLYGPGDVRVAHAVNERIQVDEIVDAVAVLATFISSWSA